jgi:hypothetical protein
MAVVRRISIIGSASAAGFFAEAFAGLACGGDGCWARMYAGKTNEQSTKVNSETLFDITLLRRRLAGEIFKHGWTGWEGCKAIQDSGFRFETSDLKSQILILLILSIHVNS